MSVWTGWQNIIILFWKLQFHFWEYINRNQTIILDSHRPSHLQCRCFSVPANTYKYSCNRSYMDLCYRISVPNAIHVHLYTISVTGITGIPVTKVPYIYFGKFSCIPCIPTPPAKCIHVTDLRWSLYQKLHLSLNRVIHVSLFKKIHVSVFQ